MPRSGREPALLAGVVAAALSFPSAPLDAAGVVGDGTSGSCTEAAFAAALAGGGTVTFSCGASPVVIPLTSTKTLTAASTTIDGGGLVTLDGGNAVRVLSTSYQTSLTVRNLTIRNGRATDYGAAIRCAFQPPGTAALTVENVVFQDNRCTQAGADVGGGAIYVLGGVAVVRDSTFAGNQGGNGGAIGYLGSSNQSPPNGLAVERCSFTGNSTLPKAGGNGGHGGAIYVDGSGGGLIAITDSTFASNGSAGLGGAIHTWFYGVPSGMTIARTTFRDNATQDNGGAIFHMNGSLSITQSTFDSNTTVGQGGALWMSDGGGGTPATVTNSTFTGNSATGVRPNDGSKGLGGAIVQNGGTLVLASVTIAYNHADWVGGGIVGGSTSATTLRGSIVANNTADNGGNPWNIQKNCSSTLGDGGGNVQWPTLNPFDGNDRRCALGVTFVEPLLGPLGANGGPTETMALQPLSPVLDSVPGGCPAGFPATDQRGVARPQGAACDPGAYERVAAPMRLHTLSPCRIVDTRGAEGPALSPGPDRTFEAAGRCGVPASAGAVAVNVTAVDAGAAGNLRFYPAGTSVPLTSTLNFRAGQTRANNTILSVGSLGRFSVKTDLPPSTVHLVVDVVGWLETPPE